MTPEDKELLLKDLCARLPYEVIVDYSYNAYDVRIKHEQECILDCDLLDTFMSPRLDEKGEYIKPYLFPLSSMTEEQKKELNKKFNVQLLGNDIYSIHYHSEGCWDTDLELDLQDWLWFINWCYKNHFDIYGLIPMGLAIDATGLDIY